MNYLFGETNLKETPWRSPKESDIRKTSTEHVLEVIDNDRNYIPQPDLEKLEKVGKEDGKNGFPKLDTHGSPSSPEIDMLLHGCQAQISHYITEYQFMSEEDISELNICLDTASRRSEDLVQAESEYHEMLENSPDFSKRRPGDSKKIEDCLVEKRNRWRFERELQPYKDKIQSLKNIILQNLDRAEAIRKSIQEGFNTTRIRCIEEAEYTRKKIKFYYRAALSEHPDPDSLPPTFAVEIKPLAELTYLEQHTNVFDDDVKNHVEYLKRHIYDITNGEELRA